MWRLRRGSTTVRRDPLPDPLAVAFTLLVMSAIRLEENDLVTLPGRACADCRKRTPMLVPRLNRPKSDPA